MEITLCHISNIGQGDTVMHGGVMRTVSGTDIKRCEFMGVSIFGDTYQLGTKLVEKSNSLFPPRNS